MESPRTKQHRDQGRFLAAKIYRASAIFLESSLGLRILLLPIVLPEFSGGARRAATADRHVRARDLGSGQQFPGLRTGTSEVPHDRTIIRFYVPRRPGRERRGPKNKTALYGIVEHRYPATNRSVASA